MQRIINRKSIALLLLISVLVTSIAVTGLPGVRAATDLRATGKVNASSGAYIRAEATTKSKDLMVVRDNTKLVITKEVFVKDGSTKASNRWYAVTVNGKDGYIRSDLVDNISYDGVTMQTTDALNYRVGPDVGMTRKGTFKKGAKVTVVQQASLKAGGSKWYKVKSGNNYYFVDSHYVKAVSASSSSSKSSTKTTTSKSTSSKSTSSSTSNKTKTVVAAAAVTPPAEEEPPISKGMVLEGATYPRSLAEGCPYSLRGVIKSADKITSVKVGVTDTEGNWIIKEEAEPNSYTFDIITVDAKIKMGTLPLGSFIYRIQATAAGKTKTLGEYAFNVIKVEGPKRLTEKALECAWPLGTSSSKYTYGKGSATSAYTDALGIAFGSRKKWGKPTRTGASCDVFVSTVCRSSGYDKSVPQGVQGQWRYFAKSSKWSRVAYNYRESDLKSGDVVIYKKKNGRWHVCMYVTINGKGYIAEASYRKKFGYINTSLSKILKKDKAKIAVYRSNN